MDGVGRDQEALEIARLRAVESSAVNVEFVGGDFRDLEFAGDP